MLTNSMRTLSDGDTEAHIAGQQRADEVGDMARALGVFKEALLQKEAMQTEKAADDARQSEVVQTLSRSLSNLSKGDLASTITDTFPQNYEKLRTDFNLTVTTLRETISQVIIASSSVSRGSDGISEASSELAKRTESQAATLEETSAALDVLNSSVKSTAEGARNVEGVMLETKDKAEESELIVRNAVEAMEAIKDSSDKITEIINVIDDISFQTNLLALNAGVEAARAGEVGHGFAVVASEVRALARRCNDAATEIKSLVVDSSDNVERGVTLVSDTGLALGDIAQRVNTISTLVSDIAKTANDQALGLNEISTGVVQLDSVAQQNAAMVEEATAATHALSSDATSLKTLVSKFAGTAPHHDRSPENATQNFAA
jgi:methyl-accepting chemotaxis protein